MATKRANGDQMNSNLAALERVRMNLCRRTFLRGQASMASLAALSQLMGKDVSHANETHSLPRAKRVIYLFMSGGPSHVDTFDHKPELERRDGQEVPASLIDGIHFAMIESTEVPRFKGSPFRFRKCGQSGIPVSNLLPRTGAVVDDLAVVRSLHSETFNHDPAVCLLNTGDSRVGRPTMGAWLSYGLGSESEDLPAYLVLTSGVKVQPLIDSYWTNGFLPSQHQGVRLRGEGEPVLFLTNPDFVSRDNRRSQMELLRTMNQHHFDIFQDPEILARIRQYETAFRMQAAAPQLIDLSQETRATLDLYGVEPGKPSFANNCLLARRMVERGVRFVQLYDMGWDSHGTLVEQHTRQCQAIDQAIAGLITDLKQRGLLEDTLVIWGGEFGRTPVAQTSQGNGKNWGRDHHPHGFTMWMAGGGIRGGITYGETDEFGFHAAENKVSVHDFHATALHCLGIDHTRLTYRHQGRDFRLTDVAGTVIRPLLESTS